jgi:hypothetical protein
LVVVRSPLLPIASLGLAIEIAPGYVAVAIQRWADHTGKTPVLLP